MSFERDITGTSNHTLLPGQIGTLPYPCPDLSRLKGKAMSRFVPDVPAMSRLMSRQYGVGK
jgi:hypothetical protein